MLDLIEIAKIADEYVFDNNEDLIKQAKSIKALPGCNVRETIVRTPDYEIVLVKWEGVSRSPMHIHQRHDELGRSTSIVYILEGSLLEERQIGDKTSLVVLKRLMDPVIIPSTESHEVTSLENSITVNIYSPPAYNKAV